MMPIASLLTSLSISTYKKLIVQLREKRFSFLLASLFLLVLFGGLSLRYILLANNWPVTNSDEATMGIMALHIAYRGAWPFMFYGQGYMAPDEAYMAAPLFHLLGSSLFNLRVGLLLIYAAFLVAAYFYTRLLYTKRFALFISILLSLGSQDVLTRQLKAVGEYPELPLFVLLICILTVKIALFSGEEERFRGQRRALYMLLGLVLDIAVWIDVLIVPFVLGSIFLLVIFAKKDLVSSPGLFLLAGFMIGILPMVIYNVTVPFDQSTLSTLSGYINPSPGKSFPTVQRVMGAFFIGIPNATGYAPICSADTFSLFDSSHVVCTAMQGLWSAGYLFLWILAFIKAVRTISFFKSTPMGDAKERRRQQVYEYSKLLVLVAGGITIVVYAISSQAALTPDVTARYLVCLLVTLPIVLWQIWPQHMNRPTMNLRKPTRYGTFGKVCVILLILCVFVNGVRETFAQVASAQQVSRQQTILVQHLEQVGATRIYSEYWTCNRLVFFSEEKIVCSVLDEDLALGENRYPPYIKIVQAVARPAYVFPLQSTYDIKCMQEQKDGRFLQGYRRSEYAGYAIYMP